MQKKHLKLLFYQTRDRKGSRANMRFSLPSGALLRALREGPLLGGAALADQRAEVAARNWRASLYLQKSLCMKTLVCIYSWLYA